MYQLIQTVCRVFPSVLCVQRLSAVPGLVLGAVLLAGLPTRVLQVAIAASVVVAIIHRLRRRRIVVNSRWLGPAAGVTWGALTAATTAGGPPLLLYLMHRHDDARTIRDTIVAANLIRLPLSLALTAAATVAAAFQ